MLQPPSKRNAPLTERPQVAPVWLVLLLAVLVGSGLWVLYPRSDLEARLQKTDGNLDLTESYLRNLLRSEPDDATLRDMLYRIEKAKALRPAPNSQQSSDLKEKTPANSWAFWQESYEHFRKFSDKDKAGKESIRLTALTLQKQLPIDALDEAQLLFSAQAALVLGDLELSQHHFSALMAHPESQGDQLQILEVAAQSTLGQGYYEQAAHWYVEAAHSTDVQDKKKNYLIAAVETLQAGNQTTEALQLAEREFDRFLDDPEILNKLIDIARAAGKPGVAQNYVKRLLKTSEFNQPLYIDIESNPIETAQSNFFWDDQILNLNPIAQKVANRTSSKLPADNKTYELAYTVFLENRNLEDAWKVAKAAVQKSPDNIDWRKRLASVSEWTNRPSEALAQWHFIARKTNDYIAWQHVLRLAPGQLDDTVLVDALRYQIRRSPQEKRWLREAVEAYERLGEPQKSIELIQKYGNGEQSYEEALALLYENTGQNFLALQQWKKIFSTPENLTPDRAMKAAVLALKLGQGHKGLQWLRDSASMPMPIAEQRADFLRMHSEIADLQNANQEAEQAYAALIISENATPQDFNAFIELLRQKESLKEAATVAHTAWHRFHQTPYLIQALTLGVATQDWNSMTPLISEIQTALPQELQTKVLEDPAIYSLLGSYYQATQQYDMARATYGTGLKMFPESDDLQQAALWLAIDAQDAVSIRQLLQHNEPQWKLNTDLHDVLAAAYQSLSLPQIALDHYLRPHIEERQSDFLWMMAYADALEQNQQGELAWQIRQQLLRSLAFPADTKAGLAQWLDEDKQDKVRQLARARLLMQQHSGDASTEVLREIMRLDVALSNPSMLSQAANDTLMGWYLEQGQYAAVRNRLWENFARSRSQNTPLWAEISVVMGEENPADVGHLFERHQEAISRHDRISAALIVGDTRQAQTDAFDIQTQQVHDDPLHQQLAESLLAFSDYTGLFYSARKFSELSEHSKTAHLHWAISPHWSADVSAFETSRSSRNAEVLQSPSNEKGLDGYLRWKRKESIGTLRLGQRKSLASYHPVQVQWEQRLGSRMHGRIEAGRELPTEESTLLRLGGMKQRIGAGLSYGFTRQDVVSLDHWRDRFSLQSGADIGNGNVTTLQYTHRLRNETPRLEIGAFWSAYRYNDRNSSLQGEDLRILRYIPNQTNTTLTPNLLLPLNFNYFGLTFSTNQSYAQEYTRGIQPFASSTLTHHSRDGMGYGISFGLAGSLLGQDHFMLGVNFSKSSPQTRGSTHELQMSYRRHF